MNHRQQGETIKRLAIAAAAVAFTAPAAAAAGPASDEFSALLDSLNHRLEEEVPGVRADRAEWLGAEAIGQTVFADDRTKQTGADFVPGDPRRGSFLDIAYEFQITKIGVYHRPFEVIARPGDIRDWASARDSVRREEKDPIAFSGQVEGR